MTFLALPSLAWASACSMLALATVALDTVSLVAITASPGKPRVERQEGSMQSAATQRSGMT